MQALDRGSRKATFSDQSRFSDCGGTANPDELSNEQNLNFESLYAEYLTTGKIEAPFCYLTTGTSIDD